MGFEGNDREYVRVTEALKTPLGPEVTVNDNGKTFTVRPGKSEGELVVVRTLTRGGMTADDISPEALRAIQKAFSELTEQA